MAAQHLSIIGDVQGVGFRHAMCVEARRLQLAGWVRNRKDGSVEAVAMGDAAALAQFAQWAQLGPTAAHVGAVQTRPAKETEAADMPFPFSQRPTV